MTHKLIQESILAAAAAMVVSGLIGLMPSNNPKIFLARGSVGGIGAIFASRRLCLQLKEKIERDITTQVKQELESQSQHQSMQNQIENLENHLKNLENWYSNVIPTILTTKIIIM
ncbi:MAG: hypothetical protein ACRC2R_03385 [Xenococcaceae cyanobacterium]